MHAKFVRSASSLPTRKPAAWSDRLVELRRRLDVGDADPEVVDVAAVPERAVVDSLDAVPVRIEEEGAVVVVAVLRPQAGLAVALVARRSSPFARTRRRPRGTAPRSRCAADGSPGSPRPPPRAKSRPTRRSARRCACARSRAPAGRSRRSAPTQGDLEVRIVTWSNTQTIIAKCVHGAREHGRGRRTAACTSAASRGSGSHRGRSARSPRSV